MTDKHIIAEGENWNITRNDEDVARTFLHVNAPIRAALDVTDHPKVKCSLELPTSFVDKLIDKGVIEEHPQFFAAWELMTCVLVVVDYMKRNPEKVYTLNNFRGWKNSYIERAMCELAHRGIIEEVEEDKSWRWKP